MKYSFCGNSGLQLPRLSLGLWHNFGFCDDYKMASSMVIHAFEQGITHFDLANNYGPPAGAAEINFGKILQQNLASHRDEIIISSKAGHPMWTGPYGDGSSRKSLMASIHQSLKRTGLEYFDIFYSHRYDSQTPIEETMQTLVDIVRQGKALYIGISKYPPQKLAQSMSYLKERDVPCLIFQDKYSMFYRKPEEEILNITQQYKTGFIAFSPLAQGLLTDKYLNGIPAESRAANPDGFLKEAQVTAPLIAKVHALNELAKNRNQSMAQMALAWILRDSRVTSALIGTRSLAQLKNNIEALKNLTFHEKELSEIDAILNGITL